MNIKLIVFSYMNLSFKELFKYFFQKKFYNFLILIFYSYYNYIKCHFLYIILSYIKYNIYSIQNLFTKEILSKKKKKRLYILYKLIL